MKIDILEAPTFVGALTGRLDPAIVGDPPGIDHFLIDLTLPEEFTGSFAVLGVTFFGSSQPDYPSGVQDGLSVQFQANEVPLDGLEAGTYTDFRLDLTEGLFHPLTFEFPVTFNDVFGELGSDQDDVIPSGFQFYINKAGAPLTVYIDNVRAGMTEALQGDYNGNGVVDAADYTVWRALLPNPRC